MTQRAHSRALLAILVTLAVGGVDGSVTGVASAAERPVVSIGDVRVSREAGASEDAVADLGRAMRAALSAELGHTSLGPSARPLVVSATLTQLSSEKRDARTKASATISIALARADDRVLFAELRGRASVEEEAGNLPALRRAAVEGAVRGAVARLPEAVKRSR
jgi:hypothetical protein